MDQSDAELCQLLRDTEAGCPGFADSCMTQAAARIETLAKERDCALSDLDSWQRNSATLAAQLARPCPHCGVKR